MTDVSDHTGAVSGRVAGARVHGTLIDLRTPEEYNVSHSARRKIFHFYGFRITGRHLQVNVRFCFTVRGGVESLLVCGWYDRMGYEVYNLGGGYRFYQGKYQCSLR